MTERTRAWRERFFRNTGAPTPLPAADVLPKAPSTATGNVSHECVPTKTTPAACGAASGSTPDAGQEGNRGAGKLNSLAPIGGEGRGEGARQRQLSGLEKQFLWAWQALQGPELVREHQFHPVRKWRFDFAHLASKIAIELEGGTWQGSRHTTGSGFQRDCEKYNAATFAGWRVFRLTTDMLALANVAPIRHLITETPPRDYRAALRQLVEAEEKFCRDTGLETDDRVAEACRQARTLLDSP